MLGLDGLLDFVEPLEELAGSIITLLTVELSPTLTILVLVLLDIVKVLLVSFNLSLILELVDSHCITYLSLR